MSLSSHLNFVALAMLALSLRTIFHGLQSGDGNGGYFNDEN
jgi:hypothetical protein